MSSNTGAITSVLPPNEFVFEKVWDLVRQESDFCAHCGVVKAEHDWQAHRSSAKYAKELAKWKKALKRTGEHH